MRRFLAPFALLLVVACASAPVDYKEDRRVVGTENGVRLDAMILGDQLTTQNSIPFTYDVTNQRANPIAIADLIPATEYDAESRTVTVNLGSEVPGEKLVPRLIAIAPGEKKSFTGTIRVQVLPDSPGNNRAIASPPTVQLKLNFLGDVQPFAQLVGIQQNAVHDPALADKLFPLWLERNEVILSSTVPMRWKPPVDSDVSAASPRKR